jgi:hypothetical protein
MAATTICLGWRRLLEARDKGSDGGIETHRGSAGM